MSDNPISLTPPPEGYADWLSDLKDRIHTAQQRATLAVNRELVLLICIDPSSNSIIIPQITLQCAGSRTDGMPTVDQSDMRGLVTA